MLKDIAEDISELEYKLMDAFWPGPFTIVLKKKDIVPTVVTGGLDTVAVRMPRNKIANRLIHYAGVPIAAPSANISGKPSGTCVDDVYDELKNSMDYIIDGGKCEVGIESTVVKVEKDSVRILRPGRITKEDIETIVSSVILDEHILGEVKENEKVLSPGMKYRHYAPKTKCMMIYSKNNGAMVDKINEIAKEYTKVTVMCSSENIDKYEGCDILNYGSKDNLEEISSNIFSMLRNADKNESEIILIEGIESSGIGLAIMNRLIRACSHEFYTV